jgi:multiple sugar transport system permease protein
MGLRNYVTIIHNPQFWGSVYNTLCLTSAEIAVGMPLGVVLAVLINEALAGRTFFKVVYFIPVVPALVAVAIAWTLLFRADERGLLNSMLAHVGIKPIGWLADPAVTKLSIVLMDTWKGVGLVVIIVLAGLQAISPDLYEAARIDGASSWQRFRFVTLPMLRPTLTFLLITSTIGCLQMFDQLYTLGGATGGPQRSFQTMVVYLYESGFVNQRFGLASAVAYVLFVLILLLTYVNLRLLKPRAEVDF